MVILSAIDLTKKVRNEINKLAGEAQVEIATENNGYVGYLTVDDHVVACCFCYEDTYMKDKNPSCATWARNNECKKMQNICLSIVLVVAKEYQKLN